MSGEWIPDAGNPASGPGIDTTAIHTNTAGEINGISSEKTSPTNGDWVVIEDSADSYNKKKVRISNLPSGSAMPGGNDTEMQFNDSGTFEGDSTHSFNKTTKVVSVRSHKYETGDPAVPSAAGATYFNDVDKTLNIDTGLGPILQVNQEAVILVYNNTAGTLLNGKVCYAVAAVGNRPSVEYAKADNFSTCPEELVILTMDIPAGTVGIAIEARGKIRGVDTSMWGLGDRLYVSATTAGDLTNVRPSFPNYNRSMGGVTIVGGLGVGEIQCRITGKPIETIYNAWDGSIRETINFTTDSNGSTITGYLNSTDGLDNLTLIFSDGFTNLDVSTPPTIALTAGTDTIPQTNYVYILKSTKALATSTSDWPTTVEHIKVATIVVKSAATTELEGALRNQNWNDHIKTTEDNGHLLHITERLRQETSKWDSGCETSGVVAGGGTEVYVKNTAGIVYQLHRQNFPILDMTPYAIDAVNTGSKTFTISDDGDLSSVFPIGRLISVKDSTGNDGLYTISNILWSSPDFTITVEETIASAVADGDIGDDIHVVNDFTAPYKTIDSLADQLLDAAGNALLNTSYSVVVWGVMNKTGQACHLMGNWPTNTYNKNFPDTAVNDASNYSVYEIPKQFQGVGFLMARFTIVDNGGVLSIYDTEDLRGRVPNTTAGGGAGGSGVTTFLGLTDTPSAYSSQGGNSVKVNSGETALEFVAETQKYIEFEFRAGIDFRLPNSNGAPNTEISGTNVKYAVHNFDQTTDESILFDFSIPENADVSKTLYVEVYAIPATYTASKNWEFGFNQLARKDDGTETPDGAMTQTQSGNLAVAQYVKKYTVSDTLTNFGMAVGDDVECRLTRLNSSGITDNLAADMRVKRIRIRIPIL